LTKGEYLPAYYFRDVFNRQEKTMTKIVGIAGSLRTGSFNAALLRAAAELMPTGAALEIAAINGYPAL